MLNHAAAPLPASQADLASRIALSRATARSAGESFESACMTTSWRLPRSPGAGAYPPPPPTTPKVAEDRSELPLLRACESFDFGSKLYHIWRVHSGPARYILWPECHDD